MLCFVLSQAKFSVDIIKCNTLRMLDVIFADYVDWTHHVTEFSFGKRDHVCRVNTNTKIRGSSVLRVFPFQGLVRSLLTTDGSEMDGIEYEFPKRYFASSSLATTMMGPLSRPLTTEVVDKLGNSGNTETDISGSATSGGRGSKRDADGLVKFRGMAGSKTTGLEKTTGLDSSDVVDKATTVVEDVVDGPIAVEAHWSIAWDQGLIRPRGLVDGVVEARTFGDIVIEIICRAPVRGRAEEGTDGVHGRFFPITLSNLEGWAQSFHSLNHHGGNRPYFCMSDIAGCDNIDLSDVDASHLWLTILESLLNYEKEGILIGAKQWRFFIPSKD